MSFKTGDIVTIKPKYRNKDEKDERYEVVEWNEDRGLISPTVWNQKIRPKELVRDYQIISLTVVRDYQLEKASNLPE